MNNAVRIISGQWRGRKVQVADQPGLRPTLGRVRETLFNWLMSEISGARCLDAFAGTGAIGIEALSRGASQVVFVESNPKVLKDIHANLVALKSFRHELVGQDILKYLSSVNKEAFDIIFLDPPFRGEWLTKTLTKIREQECLAPLGLIYFECESEFDCQDPVWHEGWTIIKHQKAGQTQYGLLEKRSV